MNGKIREIEDGKTFKAHVWSPLNQGEAVLQLTEGTTVSQLLDTLSSIWGTKFKPDKGFAEYKGIIAGWCLLIKSKQNIFCPLGIEDKIPSSAIEAGDQNIYRSGWFHQTFRRSYRDTRPKANGFINSKIISRLWHRSSSDVKRKTKPSHGIIYTAPSDSPFEENFKVLASGPQPNEPVDVHLCLIIAVSGT